MGTDSVDEIIDDTSVLFADPNSSNKERSSINGVTNAGAALTHKMEKKIRTSKTSKTPTSKSPFVHNEMEMDGAETSDASKKALLPPSRLLIPAKTASDQPLIAYDLDSDEEIHFSRAPKSKFPSNKNPKEATARLLADDFDVELRSDEDDGDALDLIRPQSVQPSCVCCKLTTCNIQ